jgi:hypothetical protein
MTATATDLAELVSTREAELADLREKLDRLHAAKETALATGVRTSPGQRLFGAGSQLSKLTKQIAGTESEIAEFEIETAALRDYASSVIAEDAVAKAQERIDGLSQFADREAELVKTIKRQLWKVLDAWLVSGPAISADRNEFIRDSLAVVDAAGMRAEFEQAVSTMSEPTLPRDFLGVVTKLVSAFHINDDYRGEYKDAIAADPSLIRPLSFTAPSPTDEEPKAPPFVWLRVDSIPPEGPYGSDGYLRAGVEYVDCEPADWYATSIGQPDPYIRIDASRVGSAD